MGSFGNKQKAVIYCRVSSQRQVIEGHGLDGQEKRCRDYARFNHYQIMKVYRDEGISGALVNRPAIDKMMDFLEKQVDKIVVIIDDVNRLARDAILSLK